MQALQARIFDLLCARRPGAGAAGSRAAGRAGARAAPAAVRALRRRLEVHVRPDRRAGSRRRSGWPPSPSRCAGRSRRRTPRACFAAQLFMIRRAQGRAGRAAAGRRGGGRAVPGARRLARGAAARPARGGRRAARARSSSTGSSTAFDAIPRDFFWLAAMTLLAEASGGAARRRPGRAALRRARAVTPRASSRSATRQRRTGRALARAARRRSRRHAAGRRALSSTRSGSASPAGAPAFEARARADLADLGRPAVKRAKPLGAVSPRSRTAPGQSP